MDFLDKLNKLMKEHNYNKSTLSKACDIPYTTIDGWYKKGYKGVKLTTLRKLADFFGPSLDYWAIENGCLDMVENDKGKPKSSATNAGVRIPVVGRVVAGIPLEAIMEDSDDWEEIPEALSRRGEFFALKVKGDSMAPRICEGDVLIVLRQSDADSGDIVIVLINGHEAVCKKLVKFGKDGISLVSFNSSYEPLTYTNEEIRSFPVQIIGKVVENRQKY